jgi:hypothetical protein
VTGAVQWLADRNLLVLNHSLLLLCASIYLGTGVSLVLFQFPSFPELTVSNYHAFVVPPVDRATAFFTAMTMVMIATGLVLMLAELRTGLRWVPIVVLLALTASTLLTVRVIFTYNDELRAGITDAARLRTVLGAWVDLNYVRVSLWCVMWLALMAYFGARAAASVRQRT